MDKLLPELYGDYGRYINEFRSFPYILDGCKLAERRILVSTFEIAPKKFTKASGIIGYCIMKYHPHGESIYDVLVRAVNNKLLDNTQGNWGLKLGIKDESAAPMRYTETRMTKWLTNLAFEHINSIDRKILEFGEEPPYIPTKLPICLLGEENTQGIGFGYRTNIPVYKREDLVKRLSWLLGYRKNEPLIKPITNCIDLTIPEIHKQILTTGKGQVKLKGKYEIDGKSVIIRSWPCSKQWGSIEGKFQKEVEVEKSLGITDETNEKNGCQIRFTIKRQRGYPVTKLTEKLDSLLEGSITFECNMVNTKGKVQLVSPDQMLLTTYNMYKNVVENVIRTNIKDLTSTINELNIIKEIKPLLSIELKSHPDDIEKVVGNISTQLKIDIEIIKGIFEKYTIGRIFRIKTETQALVLKRSNLENDLNNSAKYIWDNKYNKI